MTTAHRIDFSAVRSYATRANAIAAVEKVLGANHDHAGSADVRYLVTVNPEGRFVPVFIGESAIQNMIHTRFAVAN